MFKMMKQLGIKIREIRAEEVLIRSEREIRIRDPRISVIEYGGERFYMISGREEVSEEIKFSEEDIKILMERTGKSREDVERALKESGGDLLKALEILGD